jgi:hypothetical protein
VVLASRNHFALRVQENSCTNDGTSPPGHRADVSCYVNRSLFSRLSTFYSRLLRINTDYLPDQYRYERAGQSFQPISVIMSVSSLYFTDREEVDRVGELPARQRRRWSSFRLRLHLKWVQARMLRSTGPCMAAISASWAAACSASAVVMREMQPVPM